MRAVQGLPTVIRLESLWRGNQFEIAAPRDLANAATSVSVAAIERHNHGCVTAWGVGRGAWPATCDVDAASLD